MPFPATTATCVCSSTCGDNGSGCYSLQYSASEDADDELLCCEDIQGPDFSEVIRYESDLESDDNDDFDDDGEEEEVTALLVEAECKLSIRQQHLSRLQPRMPGRRQFIEWILRVRAYYRFQPVTAHLAVSYMDRFLHARSLVEEPSGWPMQLLSVACLSLAAKMEETVVPSLIDLQVEGTRFVFEQGTIRRMELLVLGALNWRLKSLTPFHLIPLFARKAHHPSGTAGATATVSRRLAMRASGVVLGCMPDGDDLLEYYPSVVAAAAVVLASGGVPGMVPVDQESALAWWPDLDRGQMARCHRLMGELLLGHQGRENPRLLLSQQQLTEPDATTALPTTSSTTTHMSPGACSSCNTTTISSLTSVSTSSSSHSSNKRRKIGNGLWVEDCRDEDNPS